MVRVMGYLCKKHEPNSGQILRMQVPSVCHDYGLEILERATSQSDLHGMYEHLLYRCGDEKNLEQGKQVHEHLVRTRCINLRFFSNLLIQMYGKCGSIESARAVFDRIIYRNVYTWTIMMAAYGQNGNCRKSLMFFKLMDMEGFMPNKITLITALDACWNLAEGKRVHACVRECRLMPEPRVRNALLSMYSRCCSLRNAKKVFDYRFEKDVVTWNAMIAAYTQNGQPAEAIKLFKTMDIKPDTITFVSVLDACSSLGDVEQGKYLHENMTAYGIKPSVILYNALINLYGKFGSLEDARKTFDGMRQEDVVSWNSMLVSYAQRGHCKEALSLFSEMVRAGVKPNAVTYVGALYACAGISALADGKSVHASIIADGLETDVFVGNTLIHMYARCGSIGAARRVFDKIQGRDTISWTALIATYSQNGLTDESLDLFVQMQHEGISPDQITYVSVISACSYAGMVKEGRNYFVELQQDYFMMPKFENYGCMIDLFSKAGWLIDAEDLINNMPYLPETVCWTMLLAGCKVYGDVNRGARAAKHTIGEDPKSHVPHLLLSNLYAEATRLRDSQKSRSGDKMT